MHRVERQEVKSIRNILGKTEENADDLAPLLTMKRMLEANAVLYVYFLITGSRASDTSIDMVRALGNYYEFYEMPKEYTETITMALNTFNTSVFEDIDDVTKLENFLERIKILLTISFAHPDPATLDRVGQAAADYLPGVRFARLVRGSVKQMQTLDERPKTIREVEENLLTKVEFPYLSYSECEQGWTRYLKSFDSDLFPAAAKARLETASRKIQLAEAAGPMGIYRNLISYEFSDVFLEL